MLWENAVRKSVSIWVELRKKKKTKKKQTGNGEGSQQEYQLKLKRIYQTFGKSSFGAATNIRFGLTNIRWAKKKSVSAQIGNCETPRPSEPWRSTPANSAATKETAAAQAGLVVDLE